MRSTYLSIYRLMDVRQRLGFWLLLAAVFVSSALNFFGVALILPFLELLSDPEDLTENSRLAPVAQVLSIEDPIVFLNGLGFVVFALIIVALLSQALTIYWATNFSRKLAHDLAVRRLKTYLARPYDWFLTQHSADLGKSLLDEVNQVVNYSIQPALRILANGFFCALLMGLLLAIEPIGALVMIVALGGAFLAVYFALSTRLRVMGMERNDANRERFKIAGEALGGIKEVKVMGLEDVYVSRFFEPSSKIAFYQARLSVIGEMPRVGVEAVTFGGMMLFTLFLLQTRGAAVQDVVPVLGTFAVAGIRLMPTAQILFRDISQLRFGEAALASLEEDVLSEADHQETAADKAPEKEPTPLPLRTSIRLENASYTYPGASQPALADVSLEIPAGAAIGFVGATGAGKTTATDVLLGLIRPQQGRMMIDGTELDAASTRAWQQNIGFVPQNIRLVDDSIAYNISRGAPGDTIDHEAVERAARMASLHDFVASLPRGYETRVGDAGVRLSGGQLQRVGIARALMRDPQVIVFDEATNALDPLTEREVMDAVGSLQGKKTLIFVSHRLKTLAFCDRLYLLDHGRLIASGEFADLAGRERSFREMLEVGR